MQFTFVTSLIVISSLSFGLASAEPIVVDWSDVGKTTDIIGPTGARLYKPTLYEVKWDQQDVSKSPFGEDEGMVHGLKVFRAKGAVVEPPVIFSAKRGEVGYRDKSLVSDSVQQTRFWGQENGNLDISLMELDGLSRDDIHVGKQLNVSWSRELFVMGDAKDNERQEDATESQMATQVVKMTDFSKNVLVRGILGQPLGKVCRIKGKWDVTELDGPFHVSEVNGKVVMNVSWSYYGIHECDLVNDTVRQSVRGTDIHRGETWVLEGIEVGSFKGACNGYPNRGGQMRGGPPGMYTIFKWWKREKIKE